MSKVIYEERTLTVTYDSDGVGTAMIVVPTAFIPGHTYSVKIDNATFSGLTGEAFKYSDTVDAVVGTQIQRTTSDGLTFTIKSAGAFGQFIINDSTITSATTKDHTLMIELISEGDLTVLEEAVVSYGTTSENALAHGFIMKESIILYPGAEYIVTFQGKEYEVYAELVDNIPISQEINAFLVGIGNYVLHDVVNLSSATGMPFCIDNYTVYDSTGGATISQFAVANDSLNDAGEYTFGIKLKSLLNEEVESETIPYEVILKETTISGFAAPEGLLYATTFTDSDLTSNLMSLRDDVECTVVWDKKPYKLTPWKHILDDITYIYIGNAEIMDPDNNVAGFPRLGEPFVIGVSPNNNEIMMQTIYSTSESHTLEIYVGEKPGDIIMSERKFINGAGAIVEYTEGLYAVQFNEAFPVTPGEYYKVVVNGVEHNTICKELSNGLKLIGNFGLLYSSNLNSGEPFIIIIGVDMNNNAGDYSAFACNELMTLFGEDTEEDNITGVTIEIRRATDGGYIVPDAILGETDLINDALGNIYGCHMEPFGHKFVVGETYFVKLDDGEICECVAQDGDSVVSGSTFIGDGSSWGLSGNGEGFVIVSATQQNGYVLGFLGVLTDTEPTLSIWQEFESDDSGTGEGTTINIISSDVVLKDRNGNDCTFNGVKAIKMDTPTGGTQYFVAVEGTPTL